MLRKEIDPVPGSASGEGEPNEPYVGPRPFKRKDSEIFFGRNRETLELTSLIKAHPELLIYAQSGAGKTSLIDAQLVPTLERDEEFEVLPLARVRSRTAQSIPDEDIKNIYMFNALTDLSAASLTVLERAQRTLRDYLQSRPRPPIGPPQEETDNPPAQTPAEIENQNQPRLPRAIIFDQFEELFTLYPHRYKDRQDFFDQVRDALEADPFLRIVFSMREDYIAELDPYIDTLQQKLSTRFRLERLRKPNALKAVIEPLRAKGIAKDRKFEGNTAEALVDSLMLIKVKTASGEKKEVTGEFVDPVQLQVVCQSLWAQLPSDVEIITQDHLNKYANIDAALLTYYENSIRRAIEATIASGNDLLTASGDRTAVTVMEAKVRKWFEQSLITAEGKRNMVPRGESNTGKLPNNVVDELENQHLVRVEMRGEDKWYEISHDRLISPIIESNRRWVLQQPWAKRKGEELEARSIQWIKAGKDPKLLLDREDLSKAKNWRETPEAQAIGSSTKLELFMRESEAAIQAEEHKQIRLLASEQQARANAEHQRAQVFRLGLVVASVLLVAATVATVLAIKAEKKATGALAAAQLAETKANEEKQNALAEFRKARDAEALATEEKRKAEVARDEATKAEALAKAEKKKAEVARDEATRAEALATKARKQAEVARDKATKAEAVATKEKKKTEDALKNETAAKELAGIETNKAKFANERLGKTNEELNGFINELNQTIQNLGSITARDAILTQLSSDPEKSLSSALAALDGWPVSPYVRYGLRTAVVDWPEKHFVLRQAGKSIQNAIFTPDGQNIVTTSLKERGDSSNATVEVWNVAERTYRWDDLMGHRRGIVAIAISSDGTRLVTEGEDGTGKIWWLKDKSQRELKGLTGPSPAIAFSPDGKFVASEGTIDDEKAGWVVLLWDAEDPHNLTEPRALLGHESSVTAIAFSQTENYVVAAASEDGTVRIWDPKTGKLKHTLMGHTERVNSISFDRSGNLLTAGDDGTARIWDTRTGKELLKLSEHFGIVTGATFDSDGERVLTFGRAKPDSREDSREDNVVRVWNAKTGSLLLIIGGHSDWISAARFSSNGQMIVTASRDGTAQLWSSRTGRQLMALRGHSGAILDASFSPDDKSVLTVGTDHSVHVWQISEDVLRPRSFFARRIVADRPDLGPIIVNFDSDQRIASLGTDGSVRFWDPKAQTRTEQLRLPSLPGHPEFNPSYLADIARSAGGRYIALALRAVPGDPESTKSASIVQVWDTVDRKYIPLAPTPDASLAKDAPIYKLEFSPKGKYLLTAGANGTGTLWETGSWKAHKLKIKPVLGEKSERGGHQQKEAGLILDASFDSTEQLVATAHKDGIVEVFETANQENISVFRTYTDDVLSVAFGPEDQLITGSADGTVGLWTVEGFPKGKVAHNFPVFDVEFNDKGFMVTASADSIVRVWEIGRVPISQTAKRIGATDGLAERSTQSAFGPENLVAKFETKDTPVSVALSPDNTYLVVGSRTGFGQVFKCEACLPLETIKDQANKKNPRKLSETEVDELLGNLKTKTREEKEKGKKLN